MNAKQLKQVKSLLLKIEKKKEELSIGRDELRNLFYDFEDLITSLDVGIEDIESGVSLIESGIDTISSSI